MVNGIENIPELGLLQDPSIPGPSAVHSESREIKPGTFTGNLIGSTSTTADFEEVESPSDTSSVKVKRVFECKQRKLSLSTTLKQLIEERKNSAKSNANNSFGNIEFFLESIDNSLKSLVNIERRKVDLKQMEFTLKYPNVEIVSDSENGNAVSDDDSSSS